MKEYKIIYSGRFEYEATIVAEDEDEAISKGYNKLYSNCGSLDLSNEDYDVKEDD